MLIVDGREVYTMPKCLAILTSITCYIQEGKLLAIMPCEAD